MLDRRSLRYNLEVNIAATRPDFVGQVEASLRCVDGAVQEMKKDLAGVVHG